jgi:hypothetical protein
MARFLVIALAALLSLSAAHARPKGGTWNGVTPPVTGVWTNVTPSGVNLSSDLDCTNFGVQTIQVDPSNPSNFYTEFNCQGIWKSTDYGQTWTGPINTGTNGAVVGDCAGGIVLGANSVGNPPTIYETCIRSGSVTCTGCVTGGSTGFWYSTDGGVDWTNVNVTPLSTSRQDVYPPTVDPYDSTHLIMTGHEQAELLESFNSGVTWSTVANASPLMGSAGTAFAFFVNTGSSATTKTSFFMIPQDQPNDTYLTTNDGSSWTNVDEATHNHGAEQVYQIGSGKIFLPELYSAEGTGIISSTNGGSTWTSSFSNGSGEVLVVGTSKNIYAMNGWACNSAGSGNTCGIGPALEVMPQPGTGSWTSATTPSGMTGNGAASAAVTNNGSNNVIVAAMWLSGLWRYVEP